MDAKDRASALPSPPARCCAFIGLLAAALFGISAPLANRLLGELRLQLLAGLLYLGAGLSLSLYRAVRRRTDEAPLRRGDALPLFGVVLLGGATHSTRRRVSGMAERHWSTRAGSRRAGLLLAPMCLPPLLYVAKAPEPSYGEPAAYRFQAMSAVHGLGGETL